MSNEINMQEVFLSTEEMDTIGEVMNMSMGASATAISALLDKQVVITTPQLAMKKAKDINYSELEPAMVVKIQFIQGLTGTNIMVFRRTDMQIILNLLMGNEDVATEENFEFDDMSISAACEVTNQMMGAAATALSEILSETVDISTPDAFVAGDGKNITEVLSYENPEENIVTVSFDLTIKGIMNSSFMSVLPYEFAKGIVDHLMVSNEPVEIAPIPEEPREMPVPAPAAPPVEQQAQTAAAMPQQNFSAQNEQPAQQAMTQQQMPQQSMMNQQPAAAQMDQSGMNQQMMAQPQIMDQQQMMPQGYYQQGMMDQQMMPQQGMMNQQMMPQGYYQQPSAPSFAGPMGNMVNENPVKVKKAKFPDFSEAAGDDSANGANMGLLMSVPLEVSVEIGRTKRKIKEIAEFGQGTVIELEKQAGAMVDVIVNGKLLAHGDVVVIGDNFGVRITEIVGTKELMNSLNLE